MIDHQINGDEGYLLETVSGRFSVEEFQDVENNIEQAEGYNAYLPRVYDFRDASGLYISTSELVQLVNASRQWAIGRNTKIAIVANPSDLGTIRLFASHFPDHPIKVFQKLEAAIDWAKTEIWQSELSDNQGRYKTIALRGSLSVDVVLREQHKWYQDPDYDADLPVLWDLRDAIPDSSIKEIKDKTPYVVGSSQAAGRSGRTAILVNSHIMEMLIKQMMEGSTGWREGSRLFSVADEAVRWVRGETPERRKTI